MVGMLQIVVVMGCIYLVMKAISITQAGHAARDENKNKAWIASAAGWVVGLAGAALCFYLMLDQSAVIGAIDAGY